MSKEDFRKYLAAFFSVASLVYMVLITIYEVPEQNMNNSNVILGFLLGTALSGIINFYFGGNEGNNVDVSHPDPPVSE